MAETNKLHYREMGRTVPQTCKTITRSLTILEWVKITEHYVELHR